MRITRAAEPDPKAPDWVRVRVEPVRKLKRPVTLAEIKAEPSLAKMELIRQSRLSVAPVRDEEWATILKMAKA
jgi:predicted RNA-binding protein with PUA-like domain